jgi:hypothetical protein
VLGAEVYPDRDNPLWHTRRLEHPVGELAAPDWEADPTWKQAKELARAFLACKVSLPFFGAPALSSALNCAMNLYGQELFIAMCMEPQKARKDLAVIHDLLVSMHRFYIRTIPSAQLQIGAAGLRTKPPGFGHLDGCATQLVSGDMYRELIGPLDDGLLSLYPKGGMIHICGSHTQHIPVWKAMRSLRALQVNDRASEDLEAYLAGLRDDQVIYLQPTATMTVERAWKISGGRRLIVMDIG